MNDWDRIREALFADSARSRGTLEQAWRSVGCFVVGQPETARQAEEGLAALRIQIFDELGVDPVTLALGGRYDRCGPHHVLSTAGGPIRIMHPAEVVTSDTGRAASPPPDSTRGPHWSSDRLHAVR
jgi:hypothetical protein